MGGLELEAGGIGDQAGQRSEPARGFGAGRRRIGPVLLDIVAHGGDVVGAGRGQSRQRDRRAGHRGQDLLQDPHARPSPRPVLHS
jgi:hypothetical protein